MNGVQQYLLDTAKQHAFSLFLRRSRMRLFEFVMLLRGESQSDPRPNKAFELPDHLPGWSTYEHRAEWEAIVRHGVILTWQQQFGPQQNAPPNHPSAQLGLNMVVKGIRKGQDNSQYLVLDIDLLDGFDDVTCSPFGAVKKGNQDLTVDARIIHDLSFPRGRSVNDNSADDTTILVKYSGAASLARRALEVEQQDPGTVKMMTGDVHGAFRNIPIAARAVGRFAGTLPELGVLIIDLSCPFGWTDSQGHYWTAGTAINHLHAHSRPMWSDQPAGGSLYFDDKAWCDDHICIEPDIGTRLTEANLSLRSAMTGVLGPEACNEDKFSTWFRVRSALGLTWNLDLMSLSIPPEKIAKARGRLQSMFTTRTTTRRDLNKLLGSLRHISTCILSARPFFHRIAAVARPAPRFGAVAMSQDVQNDIRWFLAILDIDELNSVPLARFALRQDPEIHITMDASGWGLCALFPAQRQFLQVEFTESERVQIAAGNASGNGELGINLRELMSAVFATIAWGPMWMAPTHREPRHVRFLIDNTTAVAWSNRMGSRSVKAQSLLRLQALLEVQYNFYSSAEHISGEANVMADAGSTVWQSQQMTDRYEQFLYLFCGSVVVIVLAPRSSNFLRHLSSSSYSVSCSRSVTASSRGDA